MNQQLLLLTLCLSLSLQGASDYTKNYSVEIHEIDFIKSVGGASLT